MIHLTCFELSTVSNVKQLQGWTVQFQAVAAPVPLSEANPDAPNADTTSVAGINADGTFEAMTVVNNMGKLGMLEGEYQVCVIDVLSPDAKAINKKFMGFDTSGITVTVPSEKELIIEVSK